MATPNKFMDAHRISDQRVPELMGLRMIFESDRHTLEDVGRIALQCSDGHVVLTVPRTRFLGDATRFRQTKYDLLQCLRGDIEKQLAVMALEGR